MAMANEKELLDQEKRLTEKMSKIRHALIVMSGKGGVGKTTIAVNLAYVLSLFGKKTGILDVDIHGPNIAKMLGIEKQFLGGFDAGIEPVEVRNNLKAVSLALTGHDPDQPIIWRGPMKTAVIRQFLADVNWGELDYLIIDSPPGTGDEPLSVCQLIPNISGAIIVTTPQDVAILDARKSVLFAREVKVPIAGIIENMSGFVCPNCQAEINIFKKGGAEKAARELKIPFLGRVPFTPEFVELADAGEPFVSCQEKSASVLVFMQIVRKIKVFLGEKNEAGI